uniref:WASH complex subunit 3 n=1 Tax=Rhizochromulina marina TaxID=1034831 RepID=A0A7S2SFF6_9STRA|mmetsp:Transcript_29435/g.85811  ORF Transcript_29435/g.85811 Transcript_29435/m.85811 type:complete len:193 (+) Transcript_29435:26-604(+)
MATAADVAPENLRAVHPVPLPKTLVLINNFITNTTKFLNRFSGECETKLYSVSQRITNTETTLAVLECKLRSIPDEGLSSTPAPSAEGAASGPPAETQAPAPGPEAEAEGETSTSIVPVDPVAPEEEEPAVPENMVPINEHPRYSRYFKMLKMGVPLPSVQQKLSFEDGELDPELLERYADAPGTLIEMGEE